MALQRLRSTEDKQMVDVVANLMASTTTAHLLHLKVTGTGSYSQHKALGDYYESVPGVADSIAEQYQGHSMKIMDIAPLTPPSVKTVDEFVSHLKSLYIIIDQAQQVSTCSSLKNTLDEVKALINSTKYKLVFLS